MVFSSQFSVTPLSPSWFGAERNRTGRMRQVTNYVRANQATRLAKFETIHVFPDQIIKLPYLMGGVDGINTEPDQQPVAGVTASVDTEGGASSRSTLTRSLVPGMHGEGKKVDTREVWLNITGPNFGWAVKVTDTHSGVARKFAAELTAFGQQQAVDKACPHGTEADP